MQASGASGEAASPAGTVAAARAEQSLLHAKLATLRRDVEGLGVDGRRAAAEPPSRRAAAASPHGGSPAPARGGGAEAAALREELAALESALLERDATIELLGGRVEELHEELTGAQREPAQAGLWQRRYEEAQRRGDAHELALRELRLEGEGRGREATLLQQYLRKLEDEASIRDEQRRRLLQDAEQLSEKLRFSEAARRRLEAQMHELEDGFARCVGRITRARAAGVVNASLGDDKPVARFAVLRAAEADDGAAVLEFFEEPDSAWEITSLDLSPEAGPAGEAARAIVEEGGGLLLRAAGGGGTARLHCGSSEEFVKWSGALRTFGHLRGGIDGGVAAAAARAGPEAEAGGRHA